MCFKPKSAISTLSGKHLKIVDLGNNISSTESNVNIRLAKVWKAIDTLSIIWKSGLSDKIKWNFFKSEAVSVLLYRCSMWTLTKRIEKNLNGNFLRMLHAILNKSWKQLYSHLLSISQTIQLRRTRHAGHCWRKDKLIIDVLLCTPTHGRTRVGRQEKTYIGSVRTKDTF